MFVRVDTSAGTATLEEAEDCTKFHVELVGSDGSEAMASALGDLGRVDDDHVWIDPDGVRRLAAGRVGDGWAGDFEGMVGYASSKGWVDDSGAIRAHIERPV